MIVFDLWNRVTELWFITYSPNRMPINNVVHQICIFLKIKFNSIIKYNHKICINVKKNHVQMFGNFRKQSFR